MEKQEQASRDTEDPAAAAAAYAAELMQTNAYKGTTLPARSYRAQGWDWDHEVRIWLPGSYYNTDKTYPTIWVADNNLETMVAAAQLSAFGLLPEAIIVAFGAPADTSPAEFQRRRTYDFLPTLEELQGFGSPFFTEEQVGGAKGLLDFLVNTLRPELAKEFRMDPGLHGYAGHSGGGNFGYYALFNQPSSFSRYLISSPGGVAPWLKMEEALNETVDDLDARIFLSVGEAENNVPGAGAFQILSSITMIYEQLDARQYPSLEKTIRVFSGHDHTSVVPVAYSEGFAFLFK